VVAALTRPDDLPQDVWDAAVSALMKHRPATGTVTVDVVENVANAILDERERCARLYGMAAIQAFWDGVITAKSALRTTIRKGAA
jgi:hypothetical protein